MLRAVLASRGHTVALPVVVDDVGDVVGTDDAHSATISLIIVTATAGDAAATPVQYTQVIRVVPELEDGAVHADPKRSVVVMYDGRHRLHLLHVPHHDG